MIGHKRKFTVFLGMVLFAHVSIFANARDVIDSLETIKSTLEKNIKKIDVDISQTDSMSQMEQKRFTLLKQRHEADGARRNDELTKLSDELNVVKRDIQSEIQKQQSLDVRMKNRKSYTKFLTTQLGALCDKVEAEIQKSIPEKKDLRLERVAVLKRDLETMNANPEEGFARLRSIIAEEIRFGDEVSITTTSVIRLDGEVVNVKMLRIGNQWMIYVDDDEKKYGILKRVSSKEGVTFTWKEDVDFQEREMIRNAIDVKLAKKAPSIVNLPLSLSIEKSEVQ